MKKYFISFLVVVSIISCSENLKQKGSAKYISEIETWHHKRIENLKKENGWLNLTGLFWLKEGENKFGSAKNNDIVFPEKATPYIGNIILKDSTLIFEANPGNNVYCNGKLIKTIKLESDKKGKPTILSMDSFRWFVIKRGDKYGIRLRDLEAPLVKNFKGIEMFPINDDWKIESKFIAYAEPQKIIIPNVLGMIDTAKSLGRIEFKNEEKTFSLEALDEGDSFFIIFADETSGKETYGAGRFLTVEKPKEGSKFYVDFNKAYNPPCVFTKFATCPLPPKENHLKLRITAGEKMFEGGGH